MRKGKQKILAVLMCASFVLQGMPSGVFAAEESDNAGTLEYLSEDEIGHSEIKSLTEENTKTCETENFIETKEQGDDSEIEQVSQIEISSKEAEENDSSSFETNVGNEDETSEIELEIESESEENTFDEEIHQDGDVLSGKCGDNLTWKIEDGTLTISGIGDMWDYEVVTTTTTTNAPWSVYCTEKSMSINKICLEDGITHIGNSAFRYLGYKYGGYSFGFNGKLVIPDSVTSIGNNAFECSGFGGTLEIPNNVISIGDGAFYGCSNFSGELKISSSVTSIGEEAFANCRGFKGVLEIPNSVTSIGKNAFKGSGFEGDLIIPSSITIIENGTFSNCNFNGNLVIPDSVISIGDSAFSYCDDFKGSLVIPDSVTNIGKSAFYCCGNFDGELVISKNVTNIEHWAFYNCSALSGKLVIPNGITTIGIAAFYGCNGLSGDLVIPNSVIVIREKAFASCNGFKGKLIIPDSVTSIGVEAFEYCSGFYELEISNSISTISQRAFIDCSGFKGKLEIPKSVTIIENDSFFGCTKLTDVYISETLEEIESNPFQFFNALVGTYTNLPITFHCKENSYAYNWAIENGFDVEEWNGSEKEENSKNYCTLNDNNMLQKTPKNVPNIELNGDSASGLSIKVLGKEFNLVSFDTALNMKVAEKISAKIDSETQTVKVVIGLDKSNSLDFSDKGNDEDRYWKKTYREVRSLYKQYHGNETQIRQLYNRFRKLRGELHSSNATLMIKGTADLAGYMEFSYETGEPVFKEGGIIVSADMSASYTKSYTPAVAVTFKIEAGVGTTLKIENENGKNIFDGEMEIWFQPSVEGKVNVVAGSAKIGIAGKIATTVDMPVESFEKSVKINLTGNYWVNAKALGYEIVNIENSLGDPIQIYPFPEKNKSELKSEKLRENICNWKVVFEPDSGVVLPQNVLVPYSDSITNRIVNNQESKLKITEVNESANPCMVQINNNQYLMVWVDNDSNKEPICAQSLYYSIYDNSVWSSPQKVAGTDKLETEPKLTVYDGKVYVLWKQTRSVLAGEVTFGELMEDSDIMYACYENGEFTEPVSLCPENNTIYEMSPYFSKDEDSLAICWVENSENDIYLENGTTSIKEKLILTDVPIKKIYSKDSNFYAVGVGSKGIIYVTADGTYFYSEGKTQDITDLLGKDIYNISGTDKGFYYICKNELNFFDGKQATTLPISVSSNYIALDGKNLSSIIINYPEENNGNSTYLWTKTSSGWKSARITDNSERIESFCGVLDGNGGLVFAKVGWEAEVFDVSSNNKKPYLFTEVVKNRIDIALDSVYLDVSEGYREQVKECDLIITNYGQKDVSDVSVKAVLENGTVLYQETLHTVIKQGETIGQDVKIKLPNNLTKENIRFYVETDNDYNTENNSVPVSVGGVDLSLTMNEIEDNGDGTYNVSGKIVNLGSVKATECNVAIMLAGEENVIESEKFGEIPATEEKAFSLIVSKNVLFKETDAYGALTIVRVQCGEDEEYMPNNEAEVFVFKDFEAILNKKSIEISKGGICTLKLTDKDTGADYTEQCVWRSEDNTIATTDMAGTIIGIKEGTTEVTALLDNKLYQCSVTVKDDGSLKTDDITDEIFVKAAYVDKLISEIGTVSADDKCVNKINIARKAYNELTENIKEQVKLLSVLCNAEYVLEQIRNAGADLDVPVENKYTSMPVADIESGTEVEFGSKVNLMSDTDGAQIYYTLDETEPSINSILYTDAIIVEEDIVIKAFAVKAGYKDSEVVSFVYSVIKEEEKVEPNYGDILPEDIPADGIIPEGLWMSDVAPQDYTSVAIKPSVRVYDYKTLLTEKKDYTISYKNNIKSSDAKTAKTAPTITVTGKGNYTGKETAVFEILPKNISDEDIDIDDIALSYNKKVQKPTPIISWNGKKLKPKTDFQIKYTDTTSQAYQRVGSYKILISGVGNFSGQREITLTITDKKLIAKTKIDKLANQPYTGKEIKPEITIKNGKTLLKKGKDYTLDYNNNIEIGKAYVTITGMGEYSGTRRVYFNITGGSIAQAKITGLNGKMTYTGSEITQNCKLTIAINGSTRALKKDTDYTVSYVNNIYAGKATIVFKGINGFNGIQKQSFTIEAFDISSQSNNKCKITVPKTVPYAKGGSTPRPIITFNGETLCEGADYILSYKNNREITDKTAGTKKKSTKIPQVIVKGKGNYKGTRTLDFQISTQDISNLKLNATDKMYQNKKGVYGTKVEIVDIDGKKLSAGKDYDKNLTYTYAADTKLSNDVIRKAGSAIEKNDIMPVGTAIQVTATGKGRYQGTISGMYHITKADISKASIKIADQIYTGKSIEPNASDLTVIINGKTLGSDCYKIVKYDNNVNKGKAFITINGVGDYGGVKIVPFKIKSKGFLWWWKK